MRGIPKARLAVVLEMTKQSLGYHFRQGALREAVTPDGMPDLDHPAMSVFLAGRGLTADEVVARDAGIGARKRGRPARVTTPSSVVAEKGLAAPTAVRPSFSDPLDANELGCLTFDEIVAMFGSREGFGGWVALRHRVAATKKLELANAEAEGRLIPRDFVATHMLGYVERVHRQLLRDTAITIARRVAAQARAGETAEQMEATARDLISQQLEALRATMVRLVGEQETSDGEQRRSA